LGCNTFVHGSNARNLSVKLSLTSKNALSFLLLFILSSTKLEIKAEQFLSGSKEGWWGEGGGVG
jgi:hypothetical protein